MRVLYLMGTVLYLLWWSSIHSFGSGFRTIYESMNVELPYLSTAFLEIATQSNLYAPVFYLVLSAWLLHSLAWVLPGIDKLENQSLSIQRCLINALTLRLFFPMALFIISFITLCSPMLTLVNGAC